ncbi:Polyphosphate kinase [Handroanthus impetiginosus]|uniref:NAD(P)H-quinone oxidoreductase subunit 5, chloroplastic n=1 Tax=Handroanthus impetiginosus TaxID=429701 RepID=A0A2G9GMZ1_9LAMI|nr:Polyphosphate kinase [Handroanthus impetiginosus]
MEQTYQYAWIIHFLPLPIPMLIGVGLFLFLTATKNLHHMWAFPSILLLSIVMIFATNLSIQQINTSSIYQYLWSWTLDYDFSLEFGYLIDPLASIMSMLITTVGIMVLVYSDNYKSQNMVLIGSLTKYVPITKTSFLLGTLSLCGTQPLACFWSKDEILNDSWLYLPIFAIIAWAIAGLTAFCMFWIYLLTFEGHLNVHLQNYSGSQNTSLYSISLWGKTYRRDDIVRKTNRGRAFINVVHFDTKKYFSYHYESDNTILFPLLVLVLFTLFVGSLGIPFNQEGTDLDILSKWVKENHWDKILNVLYNWLYNRAYIDVSSSTSFTEAIRGLVQLTHFFYRRVINGITNGLAL